MSWRVPKMPPPVPPSPAHPIPPKVITDLEQLYFNPFIKCMVDNDLSVLVVAGQPAPSTLYSAWMSLLSQFYELMGSKEAADYVKKASKMEGLNTRITHVSIAVGCMRELMAADQWTDIEQLAAVLKDWGFKKGFSKDSIDKDMASVTRELSNSRLKLAQLQQNYEQQEERKGKKGQSMKKEDWVKTLHAIEVYRKMGIDRTKLNMYDFALYYKELQDYNALLTSQQRNHGSR